MKSGMKVITNLSDFKSNMKALHTKQLMTNPAENVILRQGDEVLILGSVPVKICKEYLAKKQINNQN